MAFLLLVFLLSQVAPTAPTPSYPLVVLLQENLPYLFVILLLMMTGAIFDRFTFPFNLPAPLFHAIASVFLVLVMFNVFIWVDIITRSNFFPNMEVLRILLYFLVFLIVFIGGYFKIFGDLLTYSREAERRKVAIPVSPDVKTWDDIGNEFRELVYDLFHRMRDEIRHPPK
ncbi:MAG: dolichyl-diphosphooligosaccharide--protein glycosyltransferase subunit 2 [Methanomicrobiales archaeon]|nr:dolichyl-diphosphooligosaccharide--protein glycosyltransferase subunit 2 [Methanomicrobiales archaeon]